MSNDWRRREAWGASDHLRQRTPPDARRHFRQGQQETQGYTPQDKYAGNDNYGKPKDVFIQTVHDADAAALAEMADKYIWLSAYAGNNPRSDYHWQCDAVYDECQRRGRTDIFNDAHTRLTNGAGLTSRYPT